MTVIRAPMARADRMTGPGGREEPLAVDATPVHLRRRYARLALVSHARHVEILDAGDPDTLIVSSDWLLWQSLSAANRHCVFLERGNAAANEPGRLSEDIILRANDWIYIDGRDVTEFSGVSLGRQFSTELVFYISTYYRVATALKNLIDEFAPTELVLFDIWLSDTQVTDPWARRQLVEAVAARRGLALTDRFDPLDLSDVSVGNEEGRQSGWRASRTWRDWAGWLYESSVDLAGRLAAAIRPGSRHRVLLLLSWNLVRPLIASIPRNIEPVFLARSLPKGLTQVAGWLYRGILLAGLPHARLSAAERRQVTRIVENLRLHWSTRPGQTELEHALRAYVDERILGGDRLMAMAAQVKRAEHLLRRYQPRRIVVDGLKNAPLSIYIELAMRRGVPVDYIWHSPWAPQNLRFDALGCDPRLLPQVTRCLSWGQANDQWLETIGSPVPATRVGNPLLGKYSASPRVMKPPPGMAGRDVGLVVQYATIFSDLRGLLSHQFYFFIAAVRALNDLGFRRVMFKIHPGIVRGEEIFGAIAQYYGLRCEIRRFGRFEDLVKAADVVVGPLVSGSALEVAASGARFLPVLLDPTTLDKRYYGDGVRFLDRVDSIREAIEQDRFVDSRRLLDVFCDFEAIGDSVSRFWQALQPASTPVLAAAP